MRGQPAGFRAPVERAMRGQPAGFHALAERAMRGQPAGFHALAERAMRGQPAGFHAPVERPCAAAGRLSCAGGAGHARSAGRYLRLSPASPAHRNALEGEPDMVIAIFGASCTRKSVLAEHLRLALGARSYAGKDYLRPAKDAQRPNVYSPRCCGNMLPPHSALSMVSAGRRCSSCCRTAAFACA